jgi:hypothetical protein
LRDVCFCAGIRNAVFENHYFCGVACSCFAKLQTLSAGFERFAVLLPALVGRKLIRNVTGRHFYNGIGSSYGEMAHLIPSYEMERLCALDLTDFTAAVIDIRTQPHTF